MSRIKSAFVVLVLTAMAVVPSQATTKVVMAAVGSSAMWQTIALATDNYNPNTGVGNCPLALVTGATKFKAPCYHYTGNTNFNVVDSRPTKVKKAQGGPGVAATDSNGIWIVWDSSTVTNVVTYVKIDSVAGNRCFFAQPVCTIHAPSGYVWTTLGNKIASSLWGADTVPPAAVQALFTSTTGVKVTAAASDIRAEDAAFAECRVNSALGNGTINGGGDDGLDGLGYGTIASGTCPQYGAHLNQLQGTAIQSGYQGSGPASPFNVLAFNLSGHDPFTNTAIPTTYYTTIDVGADPITFIFERAEGSGQGLSGLTNATDSQLQTAFSGTNCGANAAFGLSNSPDAFYAYLREPLSGTYNTAEATEFRRPVEVPGGVIGVSQETGVGTHNPLKALPCGTEGFRSRAIGTGEEVKSVQNSVTNNGIDGIGYTFFSFGNVSTILGANYGYITVDGVDPIFATQCITAPCSAPGQPANNELPGASSLPTTCNGGFPCSESAIWGTGNLSFPHVRDGSYPAWSLLRFVTTSTGKDNVENLVNNSHNYAVLATPDYVPALANNGDPGLTVFRTHYQQVDGDGNDLGPPPTNGTFASNGNPTGGDTGGDMGGCIEPAPVTDNFGYIQTGPGATCSSGPVR